MATVIGSYTLTGQDFKGVKLYAPEEYWDLPEDCKNKFNCGPGKVGGKFVPNTVWGFNIKEACRIHDCMYALGKTKFDKWISDVAFLTNMNDLIESGASIMRGLRRYRAMTYFSAVRDRGNSSFLKGKDLKGKDWS